MTEADKKNESQKKEIGLRFKAFRNSIKKSQKEFANEFGVSLGTISKIERGKIFPMTHILTHLYWHYNLNINWLFHGYEEMIIQPEKDSKNDGPLRPDDSAAGVKTYEELYTLMRIPVIESAIFSKMDELKVTAKEEIKEFMDRNE